LSRRDQSHAPSCHRPFDKLVVVRRDRLVERAPNPSIDSKGIRSLLRPDAEETERFRLKNAVPRPDATQLAATPGRTYGKPG
jgi:hypothetical protein